MQEGKTTVLAPKSESLVRPARNVLLQTQAIRAINPLFDTIWVNIRQASSRTRPSALIDEPS